jgi:hypothetical protein
MNLRAVSLSTGAAALAAALLVSGSAHGQPAGRTERYVAIGCLAEQTPKPGGPGGAARPRLVVTDTRSDSPTVYVLEGDREMLQRHVGHYIEVAGPVVGRPAGGGSDRSYTLKVESLVYVATTCPPASKP